MPAGQTEQEEERERETRAVKERKRHEETVPKKQWRERKKGNSQFKRLTRLPSRVSRSDTVRLHQQVR